MQHSKRPNRLKSSLLDAAQLEPRQLLAATPILESADAEALQVVAIDDEVADEEIELVSVATASDDSGDDDSQDDDSQDDDSQDDDSQDDDSQDDDSQDDDSEDDDSEDDDSEDDDSEDDDSEDDDSEDDDSEDDDSEDDDSEDDDSEDDDSEDDDSEDDDSRDDDSRDDDSRDDDSRDDDSRDDDSRDDDSRDDDSRDDDSRDDDSRDDDSRGEDNSAVDIDDDAKVDDKKPDTNAAETATAGASNRDTSDAKRTERKAGIARDIDNYSNKSKSVGELPDGQASAVGGQRRRKKSSSNPENVEATEKGGDLFVASNSAEFVDEKASDDVAQFSTAQKITPAKSVRQITAVAPPALENRMASPQVRESANGSDFPAAKGPSGLAGRSERGSVRASFNRAARNAESNLVAPSSKARGSDSRKAKQENVDATAGIGNLNRQQRRAANNIERSAKEVSRGADRITDQIAEVPSASVNQASASASAMPPARAKSEIDSVRKDLGTIRESAEGIAQVTHFVVSGQPNESTGGNRLTASEAKDRIVDNVEEIRTATARIRTAVTELLKGDSMKGGSREPQESPRTLANRQEVLGESQAVAGIPEQPVLRKQAASAGQDTAVDSNRPSVSVDRPSNIDRESSNSFVAAEKTVAPQPAEPIAQAERSTLETLPADQVGQMQKSEETVPRVANAGTNPSAMEDVQASQEAAYVPRRDLQMSPASAGKRRAARNIDAKPAKVRAKRMAKQRRAELKTPDALVDANRVDTQPAEPGRASAKSRRKSRMAETAAAEGMLANATEANAEPSPLNTKGGEMQYPTPTPKVAAVATAEPSHKELRNANAREGGNEKHPQTQAKQDIGQLAETEAVQREHLNDMQDDDPVFMITKGESDKEQMDLDVLARAGATPVASAWRTTENDAVTVDKIDSKDPLPVAVESRSRQRLSERLPQVRKITSSVASRDPISQDSANNTSTLEADTKKFSLIAKDVTQHRVSYSKPSSNSPVDTAKFPEDIARDSDSKITRNDRVTSADSSLQEFENHSAGSTLAGIGLAIVAIPKSKSKRETTDYSVEESRVMKEGDL